MNKRLPILLLMMGYLSFSMSAFGQEPVRARTDAGKEVILYPDGTWKDSTATDSKPTKNGYTKSASALKQFKTKRGDFSIWYDETKWKLSPEKPGEDPTFELMGEDAYALIIAEGIQIPLPTLKAAALENARSVATDVRILTEENRVVNGTQVLCMKFSLTKDQIPFTFYGYYYGGKQGAIQVVTYTGQNLFQKYERELTGFLNGLEIR